MEAGVHHWRYRDAQIAAHDVVTHAYALLGESYGLERDAGLPVEHLADIGEDKAARRTTEETRAQPLLKASETTAHRRARHAQLGSGT